LVLRVTQISRLLSHRSQIGSFINQKQVTEMELSDYDDDDDDIAVASATAAVSTLKALVEHIYEHHVLVEHIYKNYEKQQ
jgi:hypothetical protein